MKRIKVIILAVLLLLTATIPFNAGCDNKVVNPIVIVNNYEETTDLNSVMMYGVLGQIFVQNDSKYVTNGKSSAKIVVDKDVYEGNYNHSLPYLFQAMRIEKNGWDFRDFTFVQCVEYDVYNDTESVQRVGTCLRYTSSTFGANEWTELAPKKWTTVRLNVTREILPITTTATGEVRKVAGINIYFDRQLDGATFYIDAVRIYRTNTPVGSATKSETKQHEISSFNDLWQVNAVEKSGGVVAPQFSLSKAFSTDGGSSLKVETAASSSSWYYVDFTKTKLYPSLTLRQYDNGDTLCFDVYSPKVNGYTGELYVYIYTSIVGNYVYDITYNISEGKVVNVRIPLIDVNQSDASLETGESNVFLYLSKIRLGLKTGTEKFITYIDNVRMEKGNA